mmetsp:Transcript_99828/g.291262  ORF Transcript_99828/g.291262 Transcript_99828/m.291262 type:complete len:202 (+) Transcript_99828:494-1099(+)
MCRARLSTRRHTRRHTRRSTRLGQIFRSRQGIMKWRDHSQSQQRHPTMRWQGLISMASITRCQAGRPQKHHQERHQRCPSIARPIPAWRARDPCREVPPTASATNRWTCSRRPWGFLPCQDSNSANHACTHSSGSQGWRPKAKLSPGKAELCQASLGRCANPATPLNRGPPGGAQAPSGMPRAAVGMLDLMPSQTPDQTSA